MHVPEDLKYSREHEWVRVEGDIAVVGITDFAQEELSDIVYLELPAIGTEVKKGDVLTTLEAVKTVADVYSPVSGEIVEVNAELSDNPSLINQDPYGKGWIVKIKMSDPQELDELLSAEEYKKMIAEES